MESITNISPSNGDISSNPTTGGNHTNKIASTPAWLGALARRAASRVLVACAIALLAGSAPAWAENASPASAVSAAKGAHEASDDCLCTIPASAKSASSTVTTRLSAPANGASRTAVAPASHGFFASVKSLFGHDDTATSGPAATATGADPFATDTWHAVTPSWPGTIKFDAAKHTVVLSPMGAPAIHATYSYTLKPQAKTSKPGDVASQDGELTMVSQGRTSSASFHIANGKELTLMFAGGIKRPENYLRMSPAEESAEVARIKQLMADGKLKLSPAQLAALNSAQ